MSKTKVITPKGPKVCFFSGDKDGNYNNKLVRFHIIGRGANSTHKNNPQNIVWAKHKYNMIWEKSFSEKLKIPNVMKAYDRMRIVDEGFFWGQVFKMSEYLSFEEFKMVREHFNLDEKLREYKYTVLDNK